MCQPPFCLLSFLHLLPLSFLRVGTTALSSVALATPSVFWLSGCLPCFQCEHTGFPYSGSCAPITHVLSTLTLWHRKYPIFPVPTEISAVSEYTYFFFLMGTFLWVQGLEFLCLFLPAYNSYWNLQLHSARRGSQYPSKWKNIPGI